MNDLDLAQSLFRKPAEIVSEAFGGRLPAYTVEAEAMEDSANGTVAVQFMGDTVNLTDGDPDGDGAVSDELAESGTAAQWVSVPCSATVKAGDRVLVTIQDGAPIDCTTIGWGDTVSATASNAEAIATATNQHFWSDTNGIHVSTDEGDAEGANNILINSLGILLRELTTVLLELSSAGVIVGDQSGTHLAIDSDSVDVINADGDTIVAMRGGSRNSAYITARKPSGYSSMTARMQVLSGLSDSMGNAELYLNGTSDTSAVAEAAISAYSPASALVGNNAAVRAVAGGSGVGTKIMMDASRAVLERNNSGLRGVDTDGITEVSLAMVNSNGNVILGSNANTGVTRIYGNHVDVVTSGKFRMDTSAPVVVETKSATISSTAAGSNATGSVSVAKTGYTPLGVLDWWWSAGTRQNFFNNYGTHIEGTTLYWRFCNVGSSAANGTLQARVLYVRSELV